MAITITIDSVTTHDAAPTTAPHKVSHQSGQTTAVVKWTPTNSTGHAITCWFAERGGAGPGQGVSLERHGFPCSDSRPDAVCSDSSALALCSDGVSITSGVQQTTTMLDTEAGSADGGYTINFYCGSDDTAIA